MKKGKNLKEEMILPLHHVDTPIGVPIHRNEVKLFEEYISKKLNIKYKIDNTYKDDDGFQVVRTDLKNIHFTNLIGFQFLRYKARSVKDFIDWYENTFEITKDLSIIKHIPHASLKFPEGFLEDIFDNELTINIYNFKMCDLFVDKLFNNIEGITLKAEYSRLFCDVERFKDKEKEPMEKLGQGYIYRNYFDGEKIFKNEERFNKNWLEKINIYYDKWHDNLNKVVLNELNKGKKVLILDIHSYSDELALSLGKKGPFPDICIGINSNFNNHKLLKLIIRKIENKGYTYEINYPYEGAIIPTKVLSNEIKGDVDSIMIEVNKRIYL